MTHLKDLLDYLDYLDSCSDDQFLKFCDAMEKRGYQFVTQHVLDYDYPHVTHCKDCKFSSPNRVYGCRITSFADDLDERMYSDDFCSHGDKRKEHD